MSKLQILNLSPNPNFHKSDTSNSTLQLSKIKVNQDYLDEWNEHCTGFVCLTKDGELLRPTLYRVGGLNSPNLGKDKYFMLLKYVEAFWSKEILKMAKSNEAKHLEARWCIIDENGNERIEFAKTLDSPCLVKDSCIYSINSNYYNIETGFCYGYSSSSFESKEFLFLNTRFEKDKTKCGVMKINKNDGSYELFP